MRSVGTSTHGIGFVGHGAVARVRHAEICARVIVLRVVAVASAVVEVFEDAIGAWMRTHFVLEGLGGKQLLLRHTWNLLLLHILPGVARQFPLGGWTL